MKSPLKILLALAIFAPLVALVWLAKTPLELYREKPIPHFSLSTLEGGTVSTAEWRKGKPIVINFFASWCNPCVKEIPELQKLSAHIPVYGVAMQDNPAAIKKMLEQTGNPYTAVALDTGGMAKHLEVYALPTTIVLDSLGQVSFVHQGPIEAGTAESKLVPLVKHVF